MSVVISFINEKGGIGKTSVCFSTAWELSSHNKILMIDLDGQKANLTYFAGIDKIQERMTMAQVFQGSVEMKDIILSVKENLDIVPGNVTVSELSQGAKVTRFRRSLEAVGEKYDYIFIDVNPTPNRSHLLALSCSNYLIIPMLPDIASLEANNGIAESIEEVKETTNPNLNVLGLLFNKYNGRTNLSKEVMAVTQEMAKSLDTKVFDTKIRNAVVLSENVYNHEGITEYAPKSNAAEDYRKLAKEIEESIKEKESK